MATSALANSKSPLPQVSNLAGFPSAVATPIVVRYIKSPLKQFVQNNVVTVWANPLQMIPIKPLPTTGAGGGSGQAGYSV